MFNFKSRSLQAKIMAMNGAIVLTIGACIFYEVWETVREMEKNSFDTLETLAKTGNEAIQAQFSERYGDVQAFAMNPQVSARTKQEIVEALDAYTALYGIYDLIIVADLNGKIVGVNGKDPAGKEIKSGPLYGRSVADTEWFKNTVAGRYTEEKEKGFVNTYFEDVGVDPYVTEVYGEKRIGTSFSALIKDKAGKPIGVVTNRAGSRWFESELATIVDSAASQDIPHSSVTLLNSKGVVIGEVARDEKGANQVLRDFGVLGALNLAENGEHLAETVTKNRKSGSGFSMSTRNKLEMVGGYSPVAGKKWVDSIGWSVMVRDDKAEVTAESRAMFMKIMSILGVLFLVALAVAYYFSRSLARQLGDMAKGLTEGSQEVNSVSQQLATASTQLSSSATEQAAALQETVASIDEVSAMVAKNADNAKRSQEISTGSSESAQKGKAAVTEMIQSIDEINESNQEIVKQVEEGNRQISEIVKVITEIGNKTKVINDIVFQTKLLSFNASVEAARAGEHGKGFAVVAEEVGNLAQMSGNAAKEISQMLESSIGKVDQIVGETKARVEKLTILSKEKVQAGTVTARRCGEVLDEIVRSVGEVNVMVAEIATASKEQAQGVSEINKAMNQMDQVTQANAASSQDAAASAERLRGQSTMLSQIIFQLHSAVEGGEGNHASQAYVPAASSFSREPSNVVPFQKKTSAPPAPRVNQRAVGSDLPPSRDDSRFEEV